MAAADPTFSDTSLLKSSPTIERAIRSTGISRWGKKLFDISPTGEIVFLPEHPDTAPINISDIIEQTRLSNLGLPLLLRFPEIIKRRIRRLRDGFENAISENGYAGSYRMLLPIKVNPDSGVIKAFLTANQDSRTGLEVGSKAELICAILHVINHPDAIIVCNGKKDDDYIISALRASQLGIETVLVSESPGELAKIAGLSKKLGITPDLGLRVQLGFSASEEVEYEEHETIGIPFGLTIPELVDEIDFLRSENLFSQVQILHFHNSIQTKDRLHLRGTIEEISRIFIGLVNEGAPLRRLDIGGGIPVTGTRDPEQESGGFPIDWFPEIVVRTAMEVFDNAGIPHPEILTESGRSLLAHSTLFVFDFIGRSGKPRPVDLPLNSKCKPLAALAKDLANAHDCDPTIDVLADATYHRDSLTRYFSSGLLTLRQRAVGERIFHEIIRVLYAGKNEIRPELEAMIAEVEYANMSIFRSLPDSWGLGETFPVLPISGHHLKTARSIKVKDLTCDPDGMIKLFRQSNHLSTTLKIPDTDAPVPVAVFLIGAYQEIIGSAHNLFGSSHVVEVTATQDGFTLEQTVKGNTVADIIATVNSHADDVIEAVSSAADRAIAAGTIPAEEKVKILADFEETLSAYTYFRER